MEFGLDGDGGVLHPFCKKVTVRACCLGVFVQGSVSFPSLAYLHFSGQKKKTSRLKLFDLFTRMRLHGGVVIEGLLQQSLINQERSMR